MRYVLGVIPGLGPLLHRLKFPLFKPKEGAYFSDLVKRVVAARRRRTAAGGDKRKDIINLLLEEEEEGKGSVREMILVQKCQFSIFGNFCTGRNLCSLLICIKVLNSWNPPFETYRIFFCSFTLRTFF